ncbi:MAG: response regulator transcription factor, partial [Alphaproteobacteria bacterium]|nr:response regulator transcription factor [Alphaproteobacteria bacterium]
MKILIADEHPLFRDTATRYLTDIQKDSVVLQVCSFTQALKVLEKEQNIDIIVLDMDMLDLPAEQSISKLQNLSESAKIVVISSCECIDQIKKVIKTGIVGYIPRQTDLNVFKQAFENI